MIWYQATQEEVFKVLETSEDGLASRTAESRLKQYGLNQLAAKRETLWRVIIEPFRTIFVAVLGVAALFSLLTGHPVDAVIVSGIIIVNAIIFYTQYYATTRVLRTLKNKTISKVKIIRDGKELTITSLYLVPGDIIILSEGEKIPADARVIHVQDLQVNESSLTGESVPVHKQSSTLKRNHQIYEQDNMVFQGTYVISGIGRAVVVETGERTEFGKIAQLANNEHGKSPVQQKIDSLIANLIKIVGATAILIFLLSLLRGTSTGEALRFVLALSVSAVPEGLPVALTVIIVLGMRRMAKKKALVRTFKAIEDVGQVTTIATDKTGTLTKNHLSVVDTWQFSDKAFNIRELASYTINKDELIDPLDIAIGESSPNKAHTPDVFYPFDLQLRMSGGYSAARKTIFIKGSPEHILEKSSLDISQRHLAESEMHKLAAKGYRVIGFAYLEDVDEAPKDLSAVDNLSFLGYIAFADELRKEVPAAISQAKAAGISVRLITGDHYETAFNIGKTVGLADHANQVIQGSDLPEDMDALTRTIQNKTVFARILPKDKFRILQSLKQTEIAAMTGDGVNDVPALANAHVGFAMGSGSDIAKDAGGIILLNDNFATIVRAIREGRKIYDNIRRMLLYLLSTNLGQVMTMIGALLMGLPLPVTAIQILWINLVTDTSLVLPLGLEEEEKQIMQKPPRHPKEPLLSKMLLTRMFIVSSTMALVTLGIVFVMDNRGYQEAEIQTVAFLALVVAQWMNAFNARSETESFFSRIRVPNYAMYIGLAIAIILQFMAMAGPLREVFDIVTVSSTMLFLPSLIMIVAVLLAAELHKYFVRLQIRRSVDVVK
jgi:Ca2+-transporting ATPase